MLKKLTFLGLCLALVVVLVPVTNVQAQDSIGNVSDPGLLPSSPFYFLKSAWRSVSLFITPDPEAKAELNLRYLNEDALAIKEMGEQNQWEKAEQFMNQYQKRIENTQQYTEQAKEKGMDVNELKGSLQDNALKQHEALLSAYEKAPEEAKQGLETAIGSSARGLKTAIEKVGGQEAASQFDLEVSEQTRNAGQDSQLEIQNQIENSPQQQNQGSDNQPSSGINSPSNGSDGSSSSGSTRNQLGQ